MELRPPLRLLAFDSIDSTNEEAGRRAAQGAPEGLGVVAETQLAGRGRRGRTWESPRGNFYGSLLLRPACAPSKAANLGFAAALAIADALDPLLPEAVALRFKWPNDVLLDGKKAAGILLESRLTGDALEWVVIGTGVNVASFPKRSEFPATSLLAAGCGKVPVRAVMERYFDAIRVWYGVWRDDGFAPIRAAWLARAAGLNAALEVRLAKERIRGRFLELDSEGALILETGAGRRTITAGDVFFADPVAV
jgi:BirA family biotin operon repressor/biotin-[acetyl-CoA-carboxylase] ligase